MFSLLLDLASIENFSTDEKLLSVQLPKKELLKAISIAFFEIREKKENFPDTDDIRARLLPLLREINFAKVKEIEEMKTKNFQYTYYRQDRAGASKVFMSDYLYGKRVFNEQKVPLITRTAKRNRIEILPKAIIFRIEGKPLIDFNSTLNYIAQDKDYFLNNTVIHARPRDAKEGIISLREVYDKFQWNGIKFMLRQAMEKGEEAFRYSSKEALMIKYGEILSEIDGPQKLGCKILELPTLHANLEDIQGYYSGEDITLKLVQANADIPREKNIEIEKIIEEEEGFNIICILGSPNSGKKTAALRSISKLLNQGKFILKKNKTPDPHFWDYLQSLADKIGHRYYIFVEEMFNIQNFITALDSFINRNDEDLKDLPVTIITTSNESYYNKSLANEYNNGARIKKYIKTVKLDLTENEKKEYLVKIGKTVEELTINDQKEFIRAETFAEVWDIFNKRDSSNEFALDIHLTEIVNDLRKNDPVLHKAFLYVCVSSSYSVSFPVSLLERLDTDILDGFPILENQQSVNIFHIDVDTFTGESFLRIGRNIKNPLRVKNTIEQEKNYVNRISVLKEFIEAVNFDNIIHRQFIFTLINAMIHEEVVHKLRIREIIRDDMIHRSQYLQYTIAEKLELKSILEQIELVSEADEVSKDVMFSIPVDAYETQLAIKQHRENIDKDQAVMSIINWIEKTPDSELIILSTWLSILRTEKTDDQELELAINKTTSYLQNNVDDPNLRDGLIALVDKKGNRPQIKLLINDTASWLKNHPDEYLIHIRYSYLIKTNGFFDINSIKEALNIMEKWMKKHGPHRLFRNYIELIQKILSAGIDINIDMDQASQLGDSYVNSLMQGNRVDKIAIMRYAEVIRGDIDLAEPIFKKLMKINTNPKTISTVLLNYGKMFLGHAMKQVSTYDYFYYLEKAKECFEEAIEKHKGHTIAHMFLSITLKELNDIDGAASEHGLTLYWNRENNKKDEEIYGKKGNVYLKFDRYEDAFEWFKKANVKSPRFWVNWWKLGQVKMKKAAVYKDEGDVVKAERYFDEALFAYEKAKTFARHPLLLPASEDIPYGINECRKQLQQLDMITLTTRAILGRNNKIIGRRKDGMPILFDEADDNSKLVKVGDVVTVLVTRESERFIIGKVINWIARDGATSTQPPSLRRSRTSLKP